jgi:hypothetical protein
VAPPAFDQDLGLAQAVEDLSLEQLVKQAGVEALDIAVLPRAARRSVTPIWRIASAVLWPCDIKTSTWRSFATISSGL